MPLFSQFSFPIHKQKSKVLLNSITFCYFSQTNVRFRNKIYKIFSILLIPSGEICCIIIQKLFLCRNLRIILFQSHYKYVLLNCNASSYAKPLHGGLMPNAIHVFPRFVQQVPKPDPTVTKSPLISFFMTTVCHTVRTASNPMPMYVTFTACSARHPHGTYEIHLSAAIFLS